MINNLRIPLHMFRKIGNITWKGHSSDDKDKCCGTETNASVRSKRVQSTSSLILWARCQDFLSFYLKQEVNITHDL